MKQQYLQLSNHIMKTKAMSKKNQHSWQFLQKKSSQHGMTGEECKFLHPAPCRKYMENPERSIYMENHEIADSTVLCFDDYIGILLGRKDEEDTQMLQNYLHKLYKWIDTNIMKLNAYKFELLRYGKEQEIISATTYKSYDLNIDDKEQVRDLGIMMSNSHFHSSY